MTSSAGPQEAHWEEVFRSTATERLSWFTAYPSISLELIRRAAPDLGSRILDVGGGDSLLVDHLLGDGYRRVTVLDISARAIERARLRLGARANRATWITEDLLNAPDLEAVDVWHDRAFFHFLTDPGRRGRYLATLVRTLTPRGAVILATFAPDGPEQCSGLPVRRYDEQQLAVELGGKFVLIEARRDRHRTPRNDEQHFMYASFLRLPVGPDNRPHEVAP
jgi:SAM-dependent methyltransferase